MTSNDQEKPEVTSPVTPTVTHDALSSAWSGTTTNDQIEPPVDIVPQPRFEFAEEPAEEPQVTAPGLPPEPTDPSERSNLGRKVKQLQDQLSGFMSEIRGMVVPGQPSQSPPSYGQGQPPPGTQEQSYRPEEEVVTTAADVFKVMEHYEKQKTQRRDQYSNEFLREVQRLGNESPDIHAEITREMFEIANSPYNVKYSENPVADANLNYSKAMRSVFTKKYASSTNRPAGPPQGVRPTVASNAVPISTQTPGVSDQKTKIDRVASEYLNSIARSPYGAMTEESVKTALAGDIPSYLNRR